MTETATRPTLVIYRRPGCHLCDDAELLLRDELAIRARSGLAPITVTRVDVSRDAGLRGALRAEIPVFAIGSVESDSCRPSARCATSSTARSPSRARDRASVVDLTLGAALLAGLISFLSPCVLPVVPAYLGQLGILAVQTR